MCLALFDFRQNVDYRLEILSGLTVAMADDIIEVNMFGDPTYKVLTDQT